MILVTFTCTTIIWTKYRCRSCITSYITVLSCSLRSNVHTVRYIDVFILLHIFSKAALKSTLSCCTTFLWLIEFEKLTAHIKSEALSYSPPPLAKWPWFFLTLLFLCLVEFLWLLFMAVFLQMCNVHSTRLTLFFSLSHTLSISFLLLLSLFLHWKLVFAQCLLFWRAPVD